MRKVSSTFKTNLISLNFCFHNFGNTNLLCFFKIMLKFQDLMLQERRSFLAADLVVNIGPMTMINIDHHHHQHHSSTQTLVVFEICLIKSDTLHFLISQLAGEDNSYYFSGTVNFNVPAHRSKTFMRKTLIKYPIEIVFIQQHRHRERKHFEYPQELNL